MDERKSTHKTVFNGWAVGKGRGVVGVLIKSFLPHFRDFLVFFFLLIYHPLENSTSKTIGTL